MEETLKFLFVSGQLYFSPTIQFIHSATDFLLLCSYLIVHVNPAANLQTDAS